MTETEDGVTRSTKWSFVLAAVLASLGLAVALAHPQTPASGDAARPVAHTEVWYGRWWMWAVGVAVFLVVVIALTNRGGRSKI